MNTQGIETLKAVARRSLWLIALLIVLGIVLMNLLRHSQGAQYQASALVLVSALPQVAAVRASTEHPIRQLADGARFVWNHEHLRPIVITAILFNTAWFCLQGVYVAYAMSRLEMSSGQTGATLALYGVGMIAGCGVSAAVRCSALRAKLEAGRRPAHGRPTGRSGRAQGRRTGEVHRPRRLVDSSEPK